MANTAPQGHNEDLNRQSKVVTPSGAIAQIVADADGSPISSRATTTVAIASGLATNTVVKATPGTLVNVLVTTTGTNPMQIFDNATTNSGTIIGALPASPAVGTTFTFQMPALAGITVAGSATNPAVTIGFV